VFLCFRVDVKRKGTHGFIQSEVIMVFSNGSIKYSWHSHMRDAKVRKLYWRGASV
jgi:hypothetical protein